MVDVVKISVEISAEKAVSGAKRVQKATQDMAKSVSNAGKTSQRAGKQVARTGKVAASSGKNWEKAGRQVQEFAAQLAIVQGPLGPIAGRVRTLGAVMGRLPVVTVLAATSMTAFGAALKATIAAGSALEQQMFKLEAVVKATGGTAGLTANEMDFFARELARATLASTQGVRDAAIQLATFRSIAGNTFKETLRLAQDLSAAGFGSIETSAKSLGRALEDPAVGLSALRRVGVSFSQAQTDVINALVRTGEIAQAQTLVLEGVRVQVDGLAEAEAKGLAGSADSLGQSWTELLETFNDTFDIVDKVKAGIDALTDAINWLQGAVEEDINLRVLVREDNRLRDLQDQLEEMGRRREVILSIKPENEQALRVQQEGLQAVDEEMNNLIKSATMTQKALDGLEFKLADRIRAEQAELARLQDSIRRSQEEWTINPWQIYKNMVDEDYYGQRIEQTQERLQELGEIQRGLAEERRKQGDAEIAADAMQLALKQEKLNKLAEEERIAVRRIQQELEVAKAGKVSLDIAKKRVQLRQRIMEDEKIRPENKEAVIALAMAWLDAVKRVQDGQKAYEELKRKIEANDKVLDASAKRVAKFGENLRKTFDPEYALKLKTDEIQDAVLASMGTLEPIPVEVEQRATEAAKDRAFQQAMALDQLNARQEHYLELKRIEIDLEKQLIRNDLEDRQIGLFEANKRLDAVTQMRIKSLQEEIDLMNRSGVVNDKRRQQIKIAMTELRGELGRTADMFDDIYAGAVGTFFERVSNDVNDISEHFKQLGDDIYNSINRVVTQNLADLLIGQLGLGDLTATLFGDKTPTEKSAAAGAAGKAAGQVAAETVVRTGFPGGGEKGGECNPCAIFGDSGQVLTNFPTHVDSTLTDFNSDLAGTMSDSAMEMGTSVNEANSSFLDGFGRMLGDFTSNISSVFSSMFSGSGGGDALTGLFSLFGGTGNQSGIAGVTAGSQQDVMLAAQNFAKGGSFRVGGSGGVDSQLVSMVAGKNDIVSITRPDQDNRIQGFAKGGSVPAGSRAVTFRATPNERVSVYTPRFAKGGTMLPAGFEERMAERRQMRESDNGATESRTISLTVNAVVDGQLDRTTAIQRGQDIGRGIQRSLNKL